MSTIYTTLSIMATKDMATCSCCNPTSGKGCGEQFWPGTANYTAGVGEYPSRGGVGNGRQGDRLGEEDCRVVGKGYAYGARECDKRAGEE